MSFFKKNLNKEPCYVAAKLYSTRQGNVEGDWHIAPGFGTRFVSIDIVPQKIAAILADLPGKGECIEWGSLFVKELKVKGMGWLTPGIAAAVFVDLGFHPRAGAGLLQMACAPGLLAHGLELANQPRTAMPFLDDDHYFIMETNKK